MEHFLRMKEKNDLGNCKHWLGAFFSFSCEILSFRVSQADQLRAALPRPTIAATSRLCSMMDLLAEVAPYCAGAAPYCAVGAPYEGHHGAPVGARPGDLSLGEPYKGVGRTQLSIELHDKLEYNKVTLRNITLLTFTQTIKLTQLAKILGKMVIVLETGRLLLNVQGSPRWCLAPASQFLELRSPGTESFPSAVQDRCGGRNIRRPPIGGA